MMTGIRWPYWPVGGLRSRVRPLVSCASNVALAIYGVATARATLADMITIAVLCAVAGGQLFWLLHWEELLVTVPFNRASHMPHICLHIRGGKSAEWMKEKYVGLRDEHIKQAEFLNEKVDRRLALDQIKIKEPPR